MVHEKYVTFAALVYSVVALLCMSIGTTFDYDDSCDCLA